MTAQGEDLREPDVEEQPFHDAGEDDQALQQLLVVLRRARGERRIGERVDEGDEELVLVPDRLHLVIGVEHLALVQAEALHDVLVGVGVDGLLEGLAQQILTALRRRDVAVGAQHDVVRRQRVRGDEEAEVALDDPTLVVGEPVRVLPQGDVAGHVHFLRHPVVRAARQVLLPRPLVLERHELVDVGLSVDDALVLDADAAERGVGFGMRLRRRGATGRGLREDRPCLQSGGVPRRGGDVVFEIQHAGSPRVQAVPATGTLRIPGCRSSRTWPPPRRRRRRQRTAPRLRPEPR